MEVDDNRSHECHETAYPLCVSSRSFHCGVFGLMRRSELGYGWWVNSWWDWGTAWLRDLWCFKGWEILIVGASMSGLLEEWSKGEGSFCGGDSGLRSWPRYSHSLSIGSEA